MPLVTRSKALTRKEQLDPPYTDSDKSESDEEVSSTSSEEESDNDSADTTTCEDDSSDEDNKEFTKEEIKILNKALAETLDRTLTKTTKNPILGKRKRSTDDTTEESSEESSEEDSSVADEIEIITDFMDNLINGSGSALGVNKTPSNKSSSSTHTLADDMKKKTIDFWVSDVNPSKRRKLKHTAGKVYDVVATVPKRSDILLSKMPFKEKCTTLEQMEILSHYRFGTAEFFAIKKEILKTLASYDRMKESEIELEQIHSLEDRLVPQDANDPLKFKILKACLSEKNKRTILEKYEIMSRSNAWDSSKNKLLEWINWGLCINNTIIPPQVSLTDGALAINKHLHGIKQYLDSKLYGMVKIKEQLLEIFATRISNPNSKDLGIGLLGSMGVGKCLHPDTQLLLFFGGMKSAKEVKRGDILMGDDCQPRIVMSTCRGTDPMYEIFPRTGDSFIVNKPHMLTLFNTSTEKTLDISLEDYLNKESMWRKKYKLFSVPVEYPRVETKNDPFMVGVLLGSSVYMKTIEDVMKEYLFKKLDGLTKYVNGNTDLKLLSLSNIDNDEIRHLLDHRYIPDEYLYNTRDVRVKLLKGLIEAAKKQEILNHKRSKSAERTPPSADPESVRPRSMSQYRNDLSKRHANRLDEFAQRLQNKNSTSRSNSRNGTSTSNKRSSISNGGSSSSSVSGSVKKVKIITDLNNSQPIPVLHRNRGRSRQPIDDIHIDSYGNSYHSPRDSDDSGDTKSNNKGNNTSNNKGNTASAAKSTNKPKPIIPPKLPPFDESKLYKDQTNRRINKFQSKIPVLRKDEITITLPNKILSEQVKFLVRSLGYSCVYVDDDLTITGNIDNVVPLGKKLLTDFDVKELGEGEYAGFTLDGNGRFLLSSCLVTHNTHLVQTLSKAVAMPFAKINMGGSTDPHHFLGHGYTYEGAQPGVIVKAVKEMKSKSGIIYLDEFDKLTGSYSNKVAQVFLHISDPVQQSEFQDEYMPELEIDLSHITFIYSFNDEKNINPILLNRIPIIKVPGYDRKEKAIIAEKYIIPEALANVGMSTGDIKFTPSAIAFIVDRTYDEDRDGIRRVKQTINDIIKKLNTIRILSHPLGEMVLSYNIVDFKLPFTVDVETIKKFGLFKRDSLHLAMYT